MKTCASCGAETDYIALGEPLCETCKGWRQGHIEAELAKLDYLRSVADLRSLERGLTPLT